VESHTATKEDRPRGTLENQVIAGLLEQMAGLPRAQESTPDPALLYRAASDRIWRLDRCVRSIFDAECVPGLDGIQTLGKGIAAAMAEILIIGRWAQLDRLRGATHPETVLQADPGMGPDLARRIQGKLHIDSFEAPEAAACDGRLAGMRVPGPDNAQAIRAAVARILNRIRPRTGPAFARAPVADPSVRELLAVDAEHLSKARRGEWPTIAPRRLNSTGEACLPVLYKHLDEGHYTAPHSHTARAHERGMTRDWVVISCYTDQQAER